MRDIFNYFVTIKTIALLCSTLLFHVSFAESESHCRTIEKQFKGEPPYKNKGDRLFVGERLSVNDVLISDNKRFMVTLQTDGNLVLYNRNGDADFSTSTHGQANVTELELLTDGQLILWKNDRNESSSPWYTSYSEPELCAGNKQSCVLIMQDNGDLVAYENDQAFFSSWNAPTNAAPTKRSIFGLPFIYHKGLYDFKVIRRKRVITLLGVLKAIDWFVGFVSTIMGYYDFTEGQIKGGTDMDEIKNSLSRLSDDINKLGLEVRDGIANLKLYEPERKILNCIRDLELLIKSPANPDFMREVNNNCGLHLENALDAIADSLNGVGVHSSDLLQVTYDSVAGFGMKFMKKIHSVQQLLSMGVGVAPIFFHLANFTTEKRKSFENRIRVQDMRIQCRMKYEYLPKILSEDEVPAQIEKLLKENKGKSNQELADIIYADLSERKHLKYWFVYVYNGISGSHIHNYDSDFHSVLRVAEKNVIAKSFDPSSTWTEDERNSIQSTIDNACRTWKYYDTDTSNCYGYKFNPPNTSDKEYGGTAHAILDKMKERIALLDWIKYGSYSVAVVADEAKGTWKTHDDVFFVNYSTTNVTGEDYSRNWNVLAIPSS